MSGGGTKSSRWPIVQPDEMAWITTEQMQEVDRLMVDELGIQLIQMMENAGRHLARVALERFEPRSVTVLIGAGGNGGGGLVAARHLANAGVEVSVTVDRDADRLAPVTRHQFEVITRMGISVLEKPRADVDLIVDAVIGYSLRGAPRGRGAMLISWANQTAADVLALDLPSGLNATDGQRPGVAVGASATMTLALPKTGLRPRPRRADQPETFGLHGLVGELYVADISVPPSIYESMGVSPVPSFRNSPILAVG